MEDVMNLKITLTAEEANRNLHKFRGKASFSDERLREMPLSPGAKGATADPGRLAALLQQMH